MLQLTLTFQIHGMTFAIPFTLRAPPFVNGQIRLVFIYPQAHVGLQFNLTFAGVPVAWRIGN